MIFIDWNDVEQSRRLSDGDVVTAVTNDVDPNTTEFVVQLAGHLDWWKGVQVLDNTDRQVGFVETQGFGTSSDLLAIPVIDIEVGGKLILWKAKRFGVHTPMYIIADLEHVKGKRITFHWSAD
jgi:hypothetical protein